MSRKSFHSGSCAMSTTITRSRRYAAVPQEPTVGPMTIACVASRYVGGRLGAAPYRRTFPSRRSTEQSIPSAWRSTIATSAVKIASSGAPRVMRSRISVWPASTAARWVRARRCRACTYAIAIALANPTASAIPRAPTSAAITSGSDTSGMPSIAIATHDAETTAAARNRGRPRVVASDTRDPPTGGVSRVNIVTNLPCLYLRARRKRQVSRIPRPSDERASAMPVRAGRQVACEPARILDRARVCYRTAMPSLVAGRALVFAVLCAAFAAPSAAAARGGVAAADAESPTGAAASAAPSAAIVATRVHAVLVNGGGRREINYRSHLEHVRTLVGILDDAGVPRAQITIFSAGGENPSADLAIREDAPARGAWLLPANLAGALGPQIDYVSSSVDGHTLRPARLDRLRAWFIEEGSGLGSGDTLLFYVTDHGEKNDKDTTNNSITLWGESLSVDELRDLLGSLDPEVQVVLVMSQCFSGAFARLMDPARDDGPTPADASHEELRDYADGMIATAWRDPARFEPAIRLLDRIGQAFGSFSPRSLAELDEQARTLPELSTRLKTYAERWRDTLESLRVEVFARFVDANPGWRMRLAAPKLAAMSADERRATARSLLAALVPFAGHDGVRHARLLYLKGKADAAAAARYRAEVRVGVVMRLRAVLMRVAGEVLLDRDGGDVQRAGEALAGCEAFALPPRVPSSSAMIAAAAPGSAPSPLASPQPSPPPFPPLAEEERLLEGLLPAYMGIDFRPLEPARRTKLQLRKGAVTVLHVYPDSPAERAGLEPDDIVLGPPGALFEEPNQVREWTMRRQIDVPTPLAVLRDGEPRTLTLRPGPFPLQFPKLPGPPKVGSAAPPLELDLFRGETDLAAPRSRLLLFWATWCEICKQSVPEVLAYGQAHDVDVVAITDESAETLEEFFRGRHAEFPTIIARDPRRRTFRSYGVSGTPTFVLLDRGGVIRHYQTGYPPEGLRVDGWHWRDDAQILSPH